MADRGTASAWQRHWGSSARECCLRHMEHSVRRLAAPLLVPRCGNATWARRAERRRAAADRAIAQRPAPLNASDHERRALGCATEELDEKLGHPVGFVVLHPVRGLAQADNALQSR